MKINPFLLEAVERAGAESEGSSLVAPALLLRGRAACAIVAFVQQKQSLKHNQRPHRGEIMHFDRVVLAKNGARV